MSKEDIEIILGNINFEVETDNEWLEPLGLDRDTWKQILNYITDLQQENKQLKEDKKKAIKYLKEYQETQAKYCYVDFDYEDIEKLLEILGDKE